MNKDGHLNPFSTAGGSAVSKKKASKASSDPYSELNEEEAISEDEEEEIEIKVHINFFLFGNLTGVTHRLMHYLLAPVLKCIVAHGLCRGHLSFCKEVIQGCEMQLVL